MRLKVSVFALVLFVFSTVVRGDTWFLPTPRKYYSGNRQFRVDIVPRKLESQLKYFEDKTAGASPDVKQTPPRAIFRTHRKWWLGYTKKSEFFLVNDVAPVSALVTEDGRYVVTFDNWHAMGYGDDVIVIYRSDGEVVAKLGLEELLTEGDIQTLPQSVSSISWSGEHRIDSSKGHLILQVVSNGATEDRTKKFQELRIDLQSGQLLGRKEDRFPQWHFSVAVAPSDVPRTLDPQPEWSCRDTSEKAEPGAIGGVSGERLFTAATRKIEPEYPILARLARVQDTVVMELVIDEAGDVSCVRPVAGMVLFHKACIDAALQWQFRFPSPPEGRMASGKISFEFRQWLQPALSQPGNDHRPAAQPAPTADR